MSPTGTEFLMPFGKYKGTPLSEINSGYLHWLSTKVEEWHPPLRAAIEAERARRDNQTRQPSSTAPEQRTPAVAAPRGEGRTLCSLCGLAGTSERPLVHASCANDDVPF